LKREGFSIEEAEDGAAADRILARVAPDLVVLDLMLPGEDGLSICRRLRARGATPILMLTAKNDDIDRIVGLELGADDYLAASRSIRASSGAHRHPAAQRVICCARGRAAPAQLCRLRGRP
jgi:DNA-binding response OmpR family regulator